MHLGMGEVQERFGRDPVNRFPFQRKLLAKYFSNLSKHLKGRLVPRVCDVFGSTTILVIGCPLSVFFGTTKILVIFHGFWLVSMVFQGGFMVFHGIWLVSMVFQGGFMVFHGFWLVSMVFQGGFMVFHGFWLVSMVFQGFQVDFHCH